jgi:hypothetical protein
MYTELLKLNVNHIDLSIAKEVESQIPELTENTEEFEKACALVKDTYLHYSVTRIDDLVDALKEFVINKIKIDKITRRELAYRSYK